VVRHAVEVDVGVVPGQHLLPALPTVTDATGTVLTLSISPRTELGDSTAS
jgi:hypothetical protein